MAIALLGGAGCFRGRLPALELYRLGPAPEDDGSIDDSLKGAARPGAIAIAPYLTPGIYGGRQIAFRVEGSGYGTYPNREWAVPLGTELGELTEGVLRRAPVTAGPALFDPPNRRHFTYVWRGRVRELEEVDRGKSVFVAVGLDVRLERATDDSVIWSGYRRAERPVPQASMSNIIAALAEVTVEVIRSLAADARAAVPGTAPPAPSSGGRLTP